jgi:SAM-dependent methyltransferase
VPRSHMFIDSPELDDAIYHFKDYARECDRLRSLINEAVPNARTILDVACGTGTHAKFLKHHYALDGIDINENYLLAARLKNPSGNYTRADMMDFDLARSYDIVTCLFSAIGIVKTFECLERAIVRNGSAGLHADQPDHGRIARSVRFVLEDLRPAGHDAGTRRHRKTVRAHTSGELFE